MIHEISFHTFMNICTQEMQNLLMILMYKTLSMETKLNDDSKLKCEGFVTFQECTNA